MASKYIIKHKNLLKLIRPSRICLASQNRLIHTSQCTFNDDTPTPEPSTPVQNKQFALSFDEYQTLKKSLRNKQRVAGVPFAFAAITGSSMTMAYMYPDMFDATPESVQLVMGLDPVMFTGLTGCVSGLAGYVLGVNLFKFFWGVLNKESAQNLHARDTDFLNRLEKYRFQEDSKFEDDYYGESIKTLSDYRQWVRTHQQKKTTSEKFKVQADEKLA